MRRLALLLLLPLAAGPSACARGESAPRESERPELAVFRVQTGAPARRAIVRLPVEGGEPTVVVTEPQPALFGRASWSPDGKRLAFAADLDEDGRGLVTDVYVVNADGSGKRQLTSTGDAATPVWSPDGELIAFSRMRREPPFRASIWVVAPDGGGLTELLPAANGQLEYPGSWSPDGGSLAFTRVTGRRNELIFDRTAIHMVGKDGSGLRRLADRAAAPVWSPDGRTIAFASDRDENGELSYGDQVSFATELYVMDADGRNQRRLTQTKELNETPGDWSPDGEWILYERGEVVDNAEGTGVFAYRLDDGCTRRLAFDPKLDTWYAAPAWRPGSGRGLTCPAP